MQAAFRPADRCQAIPEYIHARLNRTVAELERSIHRPVLNFGIGAPDVPTSPKYLKQFTLLIQAPDALRYPGYGATTEFTKALKSWYKLRFGVELDNTELLPLCGAKDGIAHLPLALLNEGDEILIPDPGYPAFNEPAALLGAKVIPYALNAKAQFKIDFKELESLCTAATRYIWVNFPSNPTGQVISLSELQSLVDFAKAHNLYILYDNAYSEITFNGYVAPSILAVPGASDQAVELGSFSKSYSLPGLRMGWIVGNHAIIAALKKIKTQYDSGLSLPLQRLGAHVLENPDRQWHDQMIASYQTRRDIIGQRLESLGLKWSSTAGSLYIWASIPDSELNAEAFCDRILKQKHILFTPGNAFGSQGVRYVRVSIGTNIDKIDEYFR